MGKVTGIEWTDHTFNPWWGCERVSPACAHCYADTQSKRYGMNLWDGSFRFFDDKPSHWRAPLKWHADAEASKTVRFVFCASMSDVFQDHPQLDPHRELLWDVITETPWLTWLLLTKRPENIERMLPWPEAPDNVWLGTSIENARHSFRAQQLIETPAPAHFLSCEPLLASLFEDRGNRVPLDLTDIEWVIGGGESGPRFRAPNPEHVRELRDACTSEAVPFFWKQWGGRWPKQQGKTLDGREWCQRPEPVTPHASLTLF